MNERMQWRLWLALSLGFLLINFVAVLAHAAAGSNLLLVASSLIGVVLATFGSCCFGLLIIGDTYERRS